MVHPDDPRGTPPVASPPEVTDGDGLRSTVVLPATRRRAGLRPPSRRRAPLAVAAAVNALWAALVAFLPITGTVAAVTMIGPHHPSFVPVVRFGLATWLLAQGVPLTIVNAPLALVPLALTAVAGWRLIRAGRNTSRAIGLGRAAGAKRTRSPRPALRAAVAIGLVYGGIGAVAAVLARGPGLSVSPVRAGLTVGVFGCLAAFVGAGAESGALWWRWGRLPAVVRDGVRAGVVATLLVLASGAIATGAAVAPAGGKATAMLRDYHTGVLGQIGVILVCLAYAPNIITWAAAYLAGPGFVLAGVPELPVFAGLPTRSVTGLGLVLLLTPVVAGVIAGVLMARRPRSDGPERPWRETLAVVTLCGLVGAVLLALVGFWAAGSLGTGLLAGTGQVGWQFATFGGLGIGLGAGVGATVGAGVATRG